MSSDSKHIFAWVALAAAGFVAGFTPQTCAQNQLWIRGVGLDDGLRLNRRRLRGAVMVLIVMMGAVLTPGVAVAQPSVPPCGDPDLQIGWFETPGSPSAVAAEGTTVYLGGGLAPGLHIIDVSYPASPTLVGT
ncbi:MAG: hypothetical protein IID31_09945, partial [Planctomycetes bacterium]|nr:hypothetical protein [Planctomycetota bacterium]